MQLITAYIFSWNEVELVHQVDKWWRDRFDVKFILYDNESDDKTPEIAAELGWEVRSYSTNNVYDEIARNKMLNNVWKDCDTEYCWVGDFDELPLFNQQQMLLHTFDYCKCKGISFFDNAPTIFQTTIGRADRWYNKTTLFKPSLVQEINYSLGCHSASPVAKYGSLVGIDGLLSLGHFKWYNPEFALRRINAQKVRVPASSIKRGICYHLMKDDDYLLREYEGNKLKSCPQVEVS